MGTREGVQKGDGMNIVMLIGRTTADPEVRYTQGEKSMAVARFSLAVDRRFKKDGEQATDFINCVAFGKTAEFFEKYIHKGVKIAIQGRIQTGSYEKDGQKRYTTDVIVEQVEFAENKQAKSTQDDFVSIPEEITAELPF